MRTFPSHSRRSACIAFTFTEMLIAVSVFTLTMAAVLVLYGFSARVTSGVGRQIELSSRAHVVNMMVGEIKQAQSLEVRNYNGTSFQAIPVGQPQQGNALFMTVPVGSVAARIYYWVDNQGQLFRWQTNSASSKLWLNNITNTVPFRAVDYKGAVLSNLTARLLIDIDLAVVDSSDVNFRQTLLIRSAAEKRN